ncbi:MAG: Na+/galactose cotransporter, partial [Candidatus Helarchaeota archaeon]|nr:Na+/galactose cotransporter [Candidatus Helarchaeota archaeon]
MQLNWIDLSIIIFYFIFVLSIGWYLKKFTKTGKDFFLAGRECSSWVAGLSFLAANMGALELLGWSASAYQYGIIATHWYWIGAIPAMLFLGIFMMPFYHVSKTHSVPGFLKLRYNEATRLLSAICFSVMTLLASGISMYSMGLVLATMLGWDFNTCVILSAGTVAVYVAFAGLTSAIFNEIIQFFLIWCGALL